MAADFEVVDLVVVDFEEEGVLVASVHLEVAPVEDHLGELVQEEQ